MSEDLSPWDWIFWIALIILLGWALGKAIGLISTPAWMETVPIFTVIFMAGALWQKINSMVDNIEDIKKFTQRFDRLEHEQEIAMGRIKIQKH